MKAYEWRNERWWWPTAEGYGVLIHFLCCIWTCKLNEIIDKKHLRKVESQQGKVWMKNNGMLEWQNVFLWDWMCNDLSDKNPIFPHVSLACHECGYTTHSSSMSNLICCCCLFFGNIKLNAAVKI